MKAPKEFEATLIELQELQERERELREELIAWFIEHGGDGVYVGDIELADEPQGEDQGEDGDEYCEQWVGYCEDDYSGTYYYKIEDSDKWLAYRYSSY